MKKGISNILLALVVSLVIVAPASAEVVIVEVEGVVNSIHTEGGFALDGSIKIGSVMTGTCTYDSETPDLVPSENGGAYALLSISMTIGNYTFTHDPTSPEPAFFGVTTIDPGYGAGSSNPLFDGTIYVDGSPKTYDDITWDYTSFGVFSLFSYSSITSDALPNLDTWPDFSAFDGPKTFVSRFYEPYAVDRGYFEIYGEITSLTVVPEPGTYYVDALNGDDDNDGLSWEDAFNYLQDALDAARSGDEIRVAEGIYRPDEDTIHPGGYGYREATFQLINGVAIYGGYAGSGEPDPNARNIELYETILSGDLLGNDGPDFANNSDNSYHVVTGSGTDETAVLDGFTITAGNANWPSLEGGGMYNELGNPTVMNCTFSGNTAGWGGAMFNQDSSPTLINCTFSKNSVDYSGSGGGMYNNGTVALRSSPMLTNCTFIGNSAGHAGGMANSESNPTLTNCTFSKNSVDYSGGGMGNVASNPTLTNCTFSGNSAYYWGGGMYNNYGSPMLTNCTFSENSADDYGGGMYNYLYSSPTLTNCKIIGNTAGEGGGISNGEDSSPTLTNCTFSRNSANEGGGMHNWESNPTVTNCTFSGNSSEAGGGMGNIGSSPTVTNCTLIGNSANVGGGMDNYDGSDPNLTNCTFSGNSADWWGGGVSCEGYSSPRLTNCILWGDSAPSGSEIYLEHESSAQVTYTDVQGGWPGEGNIDADPCFVQQGYSSPISHWKFDESEGTIASIAYDSVGNNHGTIYGAQRTGGQIDGALSFDGSGDYVEIANEENFDFGSDTDFSICAWIKTTAISDLRRIVNKSESGHEPYTGIEFFMFPPGVVKFRLKDDADRTIIATTTTVNDGSWHFVAGVADRDGDLQIYHNGILEDANSLALVDNINNDIPLAIGRSMDYNGQYFDGIIDDVRIYDQALSAEEVQQHYENGLSGHGYPDVAGADYHLLPTSPCIDAGDNTAVPPDTADLDADGDTTEPIPFDLDGNPRIVGDAVDMGAYELLTLQQLVINRTEEVIAEKAEAMERINTALEKELVAYETLREMLESRDYGDWSREDILGARWKISIAILYDEDYIKKVLEKNIDKLQRSLSALGVEPDEGNDGDIPVPSVGAYEAAVLSLHQLVINLIEEAIAEKAEALERIDAALQKERQAYELLEQMLINRDYGDWSRQDILTAKSRIYVAIKYEEYLKKVLMIMTVDKLEDSLSVLGVEADVGSG